MPRICLIVTPGSWFYASRTQDIPVSSLYCAGPQKRLNSTIIYQYLTAYQAIHYPAEEVMMGDEDTVVLTPEEKDKVLQDEAQEGDQQDEEEES